MTPEQRADVQRLESERLKPVHAPTTTDLLTEIISLLARLFRHEADRPPEHQP